MGFFDRFFKPPSRDKFAKMVLNGIRTNVPLHKWLLWDPGFLKGGFNIHYLEKRLAERKG